MTRWFPRRKRRPDPDAPAAPGPAPGSSGTAPGSSGTAAAPAGTTWPDICGQFSMHLLALAEQLRISLDALESDEDDPERLRRLYAVDHAVTRMRRASLDLRTLAGRGEDALTAPVTSLLDVIRMALSGIERYAEVTVARVADLAVLGYAADDLAELLAALLDNATRYSPGGAAVSAHLAADGSVLLRVEDSGIGMAPEAVAQVNETLAGPVRDIDSRAGLHTGFPVVHRIASRHQIAVRLASRPGPASGTVAMVTLPARLLCEIPPAPAAGVPAAGAGAGTAAEGVTPLAAAARRARVPRASGAPAPRGAGLPHRERASLRAGLARGAGGGDGAPAPAMSASQQAAARRAFADDVAAFSLGAAAPRGSQEAAGKGTAP